VVHQISKKWYINGVLLVFRVPLMHKFSKVSAFFLTTILFSFLGSHILTLTSAAETISQASNLTTQTAPPCSTPNQFLVPSFSAICGGVVGFLVSFANELIKKRREPKKQISYSKVVRDEIAGSIEKDVEDKISILYNGKPATNIVYVLFDIENTGNQQIRDQKMRFTFPDDSKILDVFFHPKIVDQELTPKELIGESRGGHDRKYNIDIIKPKERLGFRFIVQGSSKKMIQDFDFRSDNDDDVSVIKVEDKRVLDDVERVREFFTTSFFCIVLIPLTRNLLQDIMPIGSLLSSLAGLLIAATLVPQLEGFVKSLVNLISRTGGEQPNMNIAVSESGGDVTIQQFRGNPTL
jgi:hypothetical protein